MINPVHRENLEELQKKALLSNPHLVERKIIQVFDEIKSQLFD
jgi:hypothetical protein